MMSSYKITAGYKESNTMKLLQNTQHRHEGAWDNGQVENETKTHHITREEDTGGRTAKHRP